MEDEKFYKGFPFSIDFNTGQDITGATKIAARFRKPGDNDIDAFEVIAQIVDEEAGIINALVTAEQNNIIGEWCAWSYVQFSANDDQVGIPYYFNMNAEGH